MKQKFGDKILTTENLRELLKKDEMMKKNPTLRKTNK